MATYEKRGHIKEYDETGVLLSKVFKNEDALEEDQEEDLFGDE